MNNWHNFSDHSGDKSSTTVTVEKHQSHLAMSPDNQPETNEESSIDITTMNTDNGLSDVTHSIQKNSKILSDAEMSNRSDNTRNSAISYKDRNEHSNIFGPPMIQPPYGRKHASNSPTPPPRVTSPKYYDAKHHLEYHGVQHLDEENHDEKYHEKKHYEEKKDSWNDVVNDHINQAPSKIAERYKFHQRYQFSNECIADYVQDLQNLAKDCNFGDQLEIVLRDQLVSGLQNDAIRSRLFTEDVLTYSKALEICFSLEQADIIDLETGPNSNQSLRGLPGMESHQEKKSSEYAKHHSDQHLYDGKHGEMHYEGKHSPRKVEIGVYRHD